MKTAQTQPFPIGDPFVPLCPEPLGDYERGCLFSAYGNEPMLIAPGSAGGNTWAPMTFSPKTNLAYVPGTVYDSLYTLGSDGPGREMQSTTFHPPGVSRAGTLTAMDPTTNRVVWQKPLKYPGGRRQRAPEHGRRAPLPWPAGRKSRGVRHQQRRRAVEISDRGRGRRRRVDL